MNEWWKDKPGEVAHRIVSFDLVDNTTNAWSQQIQDGSYLKLIGVKGPTSTLKDCTPGTIIRWACPPLSEKIVLQLNNTRFATMCATFVKKWEPHKIRLISYNDLETLNVDYHKDYAQLLDVLKI